MERANRTLHPIAIGMAVMTLREAKKAQAPQVARAMGIGYTSLNRIERGERALGFGEAVSLCDYLGANVVELERTATAFEKSGHAQIQAEKRRLVEAAHEDLAAALKSAQEAIRRDLGTAQCAA